MVVARRARRARQLPGGETPRLRKRKATSRNMYMDPGSEEEEDLPRDKPSSPALQATPAKKVKVYTRPRGAAPKGKKWDETEGKWIPISEEQVPTTPPEQVDETSKADSETKGPLPVAQSPKATKEEKGPPRKTKPKQGSTAVKTPTKSKRKAYVGGHGRALTPSERAASVLPGKPYFRRPRGAPPRNCEWCYATGRWLPASEEATARVPKHAPKSLAKSLPKQVPRSVPKSMPRSLPRTVSKSATTSVQAVAQPRMKTPSVDTSTQAFIRKIPFKAAPPPTPPSQYRGDAMELEAVERLLLHRERQYLGQNKIGVRTKHDQFYHNITGGNMIQGWPALERRVESWARFVDEGISFHENLKKTGDDGVHNWEDYAFSKGNRICTSVTIQDD
mmetsp:Transcript_13507/g.24996  ORF Transcript_13507/g.24996 Transcript_13507/m.24996 type:complete len:391 (+) Transcript_13507:68-1240(+)